MGQRADRTFGAKPGMLFGSDCNNNRLRDVTGFKRGDTVGIWTGIPHSAQENSTCSLSPLERGLKL